MAPHQTIKANGAAINIVTTQYENWYLLNPALASATLKSTVKICHELIALDLTESPELEGNRHSRDAHHRNLSVW